MYTTVEKVIARATEKVLKQLVPNGTGGIDTVTLEGRITDATTKIDGKLRGRYPVPLSPVPPELELMATTMAFLACFSFRPELKVPEGLATEHAGAMRDLEQYRRGEMVLPGYETSESRPSFIATDDKTPMFPESTLAQY